MKTFYNLSIWLTVATIFHISCIVPATAQGPGVWFDTAPYVYATPDSGTYTRTRKMQGSLIYSETWSPLKPKKAAVKIATVVSGLGEMSIDFSSSLGDAAYAGISIGSATTQIGRPVYTALKKAPLVYEASGDFPSLEPGTTSPWNGSGSVTLVALVWRESGSGGLPAVVGWGGSWSNGTSVTKKASNDGEWTIAAETKVRCGNSSCNKDRWVDTANEHRKTCTRCEKKYWSCDANQVYNHERARSENCPYCDSGRWYCERWSGGIHDSTWYCSTCHETHSTCGGCPADDTDDDSDSSTTTSPTVSSGGGTVSSGGITYIACPAGSSCRKGGRYTHGNGHARSINSGGCSRHSTYYSCIKGERAKHTLRICSRCNRRYTQCGDGGPCIVNGVRYASHR